MRDLRAHGAAALAIIRRDALIFASYRLRVITMALSAFFSLTLFYYLSRLVRVDTFASTDAYYAFVVVGLVILQVLNSTLQAPPSTVRQELVAGTFERLVLSPFGPVRGLVATLAFPFVLSLGVGLVMISFAGLVFGLDVEWTTLPLAIPTAILAAAAFLPFGILLVSVVLLVKQVAGGATWIIAGISIVAGLYFPVSLLPDWIEWTSEVQPFTPAVDLLRNVLVGTPLPDPTWLLLVKLIGFAVVLIPLSAWVLGRAVDASRRRGTIIEY